MKTSETVHSDNAPKALGPYSQARWAGDNILFLSGQTGIDPASGKMASDEVGGQAKQVMKNLGAVLKAAGLGYGDIVKTTIFLTDMNDFATVNEIYASFFEGCDYLPGRSTIQVAALPVSAKVEIEAVAYAG
jgi:2-iminobutanoate/2-iminopropanoate deaminase